jgi:MoxR-like ATPase
MSDIKFSSDAEAIDSLKTRYNDLQREIRKAIVGQDEVVRDVLISIFGNGHCLLVGVPGLAKTLLVSTIGRSLGLSFNRIQFTPDLMPSDVVGQTIYVASEGEFRFREGPVFTNILLADEVNRTPPKTQSALLEAMEEHTVTTDGDTRALPDPFICLATQNPVEYEGTYPLPEAQLDRFLLKIVMGYPTLEQEIDVLGRHESGLDPHDVAASGVVTVATPDDLARAQAAVRAVRLEANVQRYVVDLVRATRTSPSISLGVSPRGAISLMKSAKAWAWLIGRDFVTPDEVKAMAKPALRHRLQLRPEAELEGASADGVLDGLLASVPVPR